VQVSLDVEALSVIEPETSILDASLLDASVVLASLVLVSVLDASVLDTSVLDCVVELEDLSSSSSSSSSSFVWGEHSPGAQGSLNSGKSGHLKRTFVVVTMFQMTTAPPQLGHQMTGTTVESSSSLLVVIQVLAVMSFEVSTFVITPVGKVVMVEVIPVADGSLLLDEDVGFGISVSAGNGREVVLPSTRRIPDDARETDIVPLVNPDPPGSRVTDPKTIPDALPDAVMLGASTRSSPVGEAVPSSVDEVRLADVEASPSPVVGEALLASVDVVGSADAEAPWPPVVGEGVSASADEVRSASVDVASSLSETSVAPGAVIVARVFEDGLLDEESELRGKELSLLVVWFPGEICVLSVAIDEKSSW
jgi:hypothetical protein